jgi:mannose-6-phosphate isomerase
MAYSPLLRTPILLTGSLHTTIWGGRRLAAVAGKELPAGLQVGESWETDLASVARNVPFTGETLGSLVARFGEELLGSRPVTLSGMRFPLLAKFIDAQQQLSVQVHPDDAYAAVHESGKLGKTEVWYILATEPGAQLVYGLRRPATHAEVEAAIAATQLEDLLYTFEAHAGDVIFVPPGTIHAIGAGVVLYELQEYSDITYRLYDYGRLQADGRPRELHVAKGLDVMDFAFSARPCVTPLALDAAHRAGALSAHRVLAACDYFVLEELQLAGSYVTAVAPSSCQLLSVLGGACHLRVADAQLALALGDTVVLPSSLGDYVLEGDAARLVRSYVPTEDDQLRAWWQRAQRGG